MITLEVSPSANASHQNTSVQQQCSQHNNKLNVTTSQHSPPQHIDNTVNNTDHTAQHDSPNMTRNAANQLAIRTFDCCGISSLNEESQTAICTRLNLHLSPPVHTDMSPANAVVARKLQQLIYTNTNIQTDVNVVDISGDGNCLFRALSYSLSRSQTTHDILRQYIVNYMTNPLIQEQLIQLFAGGNRPAENYNHHLLRMQEPGDWGTEQEIVTAAHLLQCSIICISKYNSTEQYCLQHFPPHFIESTECTNLCKHKTIYIVNSNASHYNSAVVTYSSTDTEE